MGASRADLMGTRHTLNITYPTPQETLSGSPTLLPTSEPATATFSYTVAAGDLPTIDSGAALMSAVYRPFIYAGGKNTDASNNRTLCYRLKKNGTSVATATNVSITANQFWTWNVYENTLSAAVGDVFEVFLWQITTDALNWDYQAFCVNITRPQIATQNALLLNFTVTPNGNYPDLTAGTPGVNATTDAVYYLRSNAAGAILANNTTAATAYAVKQDATGRLYKIGYGDNLSGIISYSNSTQRPRFLTNYKITKLEWTPTNIVL